MKMKILGIAIAAYLLTTCVFFPTYWLYSWLTYKSPNYTPLIKGEVYVPYFTEGQILPPAEGLEDTLIVVDARNLNRAFGQYEQGLNDWGDLQLDSVFHANCYTMKSKREYEALPEFNNESPQENFGK